jgi:hypothetical protein
MSEPIYIVSGLPRSGTSMMMKMMEAAGMEPLVDGIREADEDNPKGYYEFERVKKLKDDKSWLPAAQGKVVKIISRLLLELPPGFDYRIVFVRRNIDEILASQRQMMIRRGTFKEDAIADEKIRTLMLRHVDQVFGWLDAQPHVRYVAVDYNRTLQDPRESIDRIDALCDGKLDREAMAAVVDPALYRQRR